MIFARFQVFIDSAKEKKIGMFLLEEFSKPVV